jgi:hypothetical protein
MQETVLTVDAACMPSKRAMAKADQVDIESRLAPYFPQPAANEAPVYDHSVSSWVPPLR